MTTAETHRNLPVEETLDVLRRHILVDGFEIVMDLHASRGSHLHDALTGIDYLDFYSFFASMPLTFNHPRLREPEFQARLLAASAVRNTLSLPRAKARLPVRTQRQWLKISTWCLSAISISFQNSFLKSANAVWKT